MRISELSKKYGYSRAAINRNVNMRLVPAKKIGNRWEIDVEDYEEYLKNRYIRKDTLLQQQNKNYSPRIAAQISNLPIQIIYYNIYRKNIPAIRIGTAWYVTHDELMIFKQKHTVKKIKKKRNKRKVLKHIMKQQKTA